MSILQIIGMVGAGTILVFVLMVAASMITNPTPEHVNIKPPNLKHSVVMALGFTALIGACIAFPVALAAALWAIGHFIGGLP